LPCGEHGLKKAGCAAACRKIKLPFLAVTVAVVQVRIVHMLVLQWRVTVEV
jgi:hypothetical protein